MEKKKVFDIRKMSNCEYLRQKVKLITSIRIQNEKKVFYIHFDHNKG